MPGTSCPALFMIKSESALRGSRSRRFPRRRSARGPLRRNVKRDRLPGMKEEQRRRRDIEVPRDRTDVVAGAFVDNPPGRREIGDVGAEEALEPIAPIDDAACRPPRSRPGSRASRHWSTRWAPARTRISAGVVRRRWSPRTVDGVDRCVAAHPSHARSVPPPWGPSSALPIANSVRRPTSSDAFPPYCSTYSPTRRIISSGDRVPRSQERAAARRRPQRGRRARRV